MESSEWSEIDYLNCNSAKRAISDLSKNYKRKFFSGLSEEANPTAEISGTQFSPFDLEIGSRVKLGFLSSSPKEQEEMPPHVLQYLSKSYVCYRTTKESGSSTLQHCKYPCRHLTSWNYLFTASNISS